jgi:hypothetical protein
VEIACEFREKGGIAWAPPVSRRARTGQDLDLPPWLELPEMPSEMERAEDATSTYRREVISDEKRAALPWSP